MQTVMISIRFIRKSSWFKYDRLAACRHVGRKVRDGTTTGEQPVVFNQSLFKSFSDFVSSPFSRIRSNITAALAITIDGKAMSILIKSPAGRSSLSANTRKITDTATNPRIAIAQYFIVLKALTVSCENAFFSLMYRNNLNAW